MNLHNFNIDTMDIDQDDNNHQPRPVMGFNMSYNTQSGLNLGFGIHNMASIRNNITGINKLTNIDNKRRTRPKKTTQYPLITKNSDDDDLIDILLGGDDDTTDKPATNITKIDCPNPLCDHLEYTAEELANKDQLAPPVRVDNIDDLIKLGKTYHCKKRTEYYGVDLKILCNLVQPLTKLQNMVGLADIKRSIVDHIIFFVQNLNEKTRCGSCTNCIFGKKCGSSFTQDMLHTVITGPPGVGKTELGKILGQVYKAMGVLSKGHMHIARRSDLVGKYLGHTAAKTQAFINKCVGGVMFIDEAYSLGNNEGRDSFSKECIDTLNQSLTEKKDFLCIIAGYKEPLERCFFAYNPGLSRRFPFRYNIDGYAPEELSDIFLTKVRKEGWIPELDVEEDLIKKAQIGEEFKRFFSKNKTHFPHYGGDMETLFLNCKIYHGRRCLFKDPSIRKILTLHDLYHGFETYVANKGVKRDERSLSQKMMYI